jgi:hypothetical protein
MEMGCKMGTGRKIKILLFFLAFLLGLTACDGQDLEDTDLSILLTEEEAGEPLQTEAEAVPSPPAEKDGETMTITLHYIFQGRDNPVQQEVPRTQAVARVLVEALHRGFPFGGKNHPVVPPGTRLLDIKIIDGIVYLDFSREFRDNHWGGVETEVNTIYSIVQTLTQFPQVKAVQFLLEGQQVRTIATGAVDLTEPVQPLDRITPDIYEKFAARGKLPVVDTFTWPQAVQEEGTLALPAGEPDALAWGDLTGDGNPEVVVAQGKRVTVWASDGQDYSQAWETWLAAPGQLLLGDTTGNGRAELIACTSNDIYIFAHGEKGYQQVGWQGVPGQISSVAVGDTTGDGRDEIILLHGEGDPFGADYQAVTEIWQYRDGNYVKAFRVEELPFRSMEVADIDGNGRREIIAFAAEGLTVFAWNGKAYVEIYKNPGIGNNYTSLAVGDLTGDGRAEVILGDGLVKSVYVYTWQEGRLRKIWQGGDDMGDLLSSPPLTRDLNGDGRAELLVPAPAGGVYQILTWDGPVPSRYVIDGESSGERIAAVLPGPEGRLLYSRRQLASSPYCHLYLGRWRQLEFAEP